MLQPSLYYLFKTGSTIKFLIRCLLYQDFDNYVPIFCFLIMNCLVTFNWRVCRDTFIHQVLTCYAVINYYKDYILYFVGFFQLLLILWLEILVLLQTVKHCVKCIWWKQQYHLHVLWMFNSGKSFLAKLENGTLNGCQCAPQSV